MNREEAMEIIKLYRNWNTCQKGLTEDEENILIERRETIKKAYQVLRSEQTTPAN